MRHYNVWQLAIAMIYWREVESLAIVKQNVDREKPVPPEDVELKYKPLLAYIQDQCSRVELSSATSRCEIFQRSLRDGLTWNELYNEAKVLREAIFSDLPLRRFAHVATTKATLLDKVSEDWAKIVGKFSDAKDDSQSAVECYALEQDTACVFHLMRVAEIGLRSIARKLHIALTHKGKTCPIEYADWDKVITAIKNKIEQFRRLPAGPKRQQKIESYSDAADHCLFMKDIWRNNVSHTRKPYKDTEALAAMGRVKEFMDFLAERL